MATGKALNGKPYAGNPHVRFDEGEVAPAATPRRGSLLYSEYCKYCGSRYSDARSLLANSCTRHPDGRGKHALFEGDKNGPFYCIHCGSKYTDLGTLLRNSCSHNPNGRYHEAYDGDISGPFTCKFCGREYRDIHTMVLNSCSKNPTRGGKHSPAR